MKTKSEPEANALLVSKLMESGHPGWFQGLIDALTECG
jgi:hypothetical protein